MHAPPQPYLRSSTIRRSIIFCAVYAAVALACLWPRVDVFSGGALAISVAVILQRYRFGFDLPRSREVVREYFGSGFDPLLDALGRVLAAGELLPFLDYGHLRLARALERPGLQAAGLLAGVAALLVLAWVDHYLLDHFRRGLADRTLIAGGPFRRVRHPRYAALLLMRAAMALALASAAGWALALVWLVLLVRRIGREEVHLRSVFGDAYGDYAARRARLIPWIY
jgi:protein-S-isoprenylcysteine O-methyltransferase Ste14